MTTANIQEQITLFQKMMKDNEQPLKEASLADNDIIITVTYNAIKVEWNGGTGYGSGNDYAECLQEASNSSNRRIQK